MHYKYYKTWLFWFGLERPTHRLLSSVFRTTIGVCKILSRLVEIWQYKAKNRFLSKHRARPSLCLGLPSIIESDYFPAKLFVKSGPKQPTNQYL